MVRKVTEEQIQRQAIWETYSKKCQVCDKFITKLQDLEVDHIIPRLSFKSDPETVRTKYDLPRNFEFEGIENLHPIHGSCNKKKSTTIYPPNLLYINLEKAQKKKQQIINRVQALKSQISITYMNSFSYTCNSPLFSHIPYMPELTTEIIALIKHVKFQELYVFELELPSDKVIVIDTLQQYVEASKLGAYPDSNYQITMRGHCNYLLNILNLIPNGFYTKHTLQLSEYYIQLPIQALYVSIFSTLEQTDELHGCYIVNDYIKKNNCEVEIDYENNVIKISKDSKYEFIITEELQGNFMTETSQGIFLTVCYDGGGSYRPMEQMYLIYDNNKWEKKSGWQV